jgi:general secretion pathway protein L
MNYLIIQLTGADAVVARFALRGKTLSFLQGVRRPLPEPGAFKELLSGFDQSDRGEKVILSIPPTMVYSRQISLPISDRRRLREILPLELAGELAVQSEEMIFDALPLGEDSHLAVWCRSSEIAPLIEELAASGVEPEFVTCSLLHWNLLLPEGTDIPCVVTDGKAMMIGTSAAPLLTRPLPALHGERELSRTIAAFELSRETAISGILRIGETNPGENTLPINAGMLDTFNGDKTAATDIAGAYAAAKGCASGTIVNFRSGALSFTAGQAKNLRRLRLTAILAAAAVLLLFVEVGIRYFLLQRDISSLNASIGSIYRELFPARKKPQDPVGEVRSEIKRLSGGTSSQRILPTLKKLSELKGEEVTGFYETEIEGLKVQLKGDARSVNDFKNRTTKALSTAEISEIKSKSDGSVSFVFRGVMKEGN